MRHSSSKHSSLPRWSGETKALVALGAGLCIALAWVSRPMLNTDGVSYLDLARLVRTGDLQGFLQGYWSPLYPAGIAIASVIVGDEPGRLVTLAHLINAAAAIAGAVLLGHWAMRSSGSTGARFLLAAFLLASNGLPRIEAVTPDVLLLALMAWVGYELIHHRDRRPGPSGVALGLAFLTKTSIWPWLLLSLPVRLWGAGDAPGRRRVLTSSAITFCCASLWLIPLSLESGHLTAGSTGRLNYHWYIDSSDARSPDTHTGGHRDYRSVPIDASHRVVVAYFTETGRWTYAPWSDPTAWDEGLEATTAPPLRLAALLARWGTEARRTFGNWLVGLLLGIVLPCWLVGRRTGIASRLLGEDRPSLVAMIIGLAGVLQFVAVHSEPRLIAPFALLFALGAMHPMLGAADSGAAGRPYRWLVATSIGWLAVIGASMVRFESTIHSAHRAERLAAVAEGSGPGGRIAVVGPAMPAAPAAFLAGARIVAQLPPRSLEGTRELSLEAHQALLHAAFDDHATVVWATDWDGTIKVVPIATP